MARVPRLIASRPARFAALVALVLLAHSVALERLSRALGAGPLLKPMATPMFTRLLAPEAPPALPAGVEAAPAAPRRPAITTLAKRPAAKAPLQPASAPAKEGPEQPTPESVTEAPAPDLPDLDEALPAADAAPAAAVAQAPQQAASTPAAPTPVAAASGPAAPDLDSWPVDTRLSYRLTGWFRGELYGHAHVQWQREASRYQVRIQIDVTPFVTLVMTSQGQVSGPSLSPHAYEELRRAGARGVRLTEDAVVLNDGRRVARPPGVQDTASQFVDLSHRFATGQEPLEVGRAVNVWLARPGAVDLWTYDIVGRETLATERLGPVDAFHLKPRPIADPRGNITMEMWFAPTLQYLPVRIRVNMGESTFVDLMVDQIEQR